MFPVQIYLFKAKSAFKPLIDKFSIALDQVPDALNMIVLVTCKNEEDPIKNEGARVFTTLYIIFSDARGQITLELVVVSGQNLNLTHPSFHACSRYLQE